MWIMCPRCGYEAGLVDEFPSPQQSGGGTVRYHWRCIWCRAEGYVGYAWDNWLDLDRGGAPVWKRKATGHVGTVMLSEESPPAE